MDEPQDTKSVLLVSGPIACATSRKKAKPKDHMPGEGNGDDDKGERSDQTSAAPDRQLHRPANEEKPRKKMSCQPNGSKNQGRSLQGSAWR